MSAANFRMRLFAPAQNGAQWRIFWRCFSEFFRKLSSSAVFPHAVSQVRGQLPHKSGDNPLPCQKKAVILHSHSALESHSRYRSTKSAGDQGLCSPQKSEIFGGPQKDASLTKVSSRVRDCSAPHLLLSPFEHSSLGTAKRNLLSTKSPRLLHITSTIRV